MNRRLAEGQNEKEIVMGIRFDDIAQSYTRFRRYRETLSELNNLGDRELEDLGLNRSQFRTIARNAARG